MLGIWVPFPVLPSTHYVLVSRPHRALPSPPADFDCRNSFKLLFFFLITCFFFLEGWRQLIYSLLTTPRIAPEGVLT